MRWLLALTLLGCHPAGTTSNSTSTIATVPGAALPEPTPTRDLSCTDALAATVKYASASLSPGKPTLGETMLAHCTNDSWSADVRRCFMTEPVEKPQPCIDMLSNYQRQQLGEEMQTQMPEPE